MLYFVVQLIPLFFLLFILTDHMIFVSFFLTDHHKIFVVGSAHIQTTELTERIMTQLPDQDISLLEQK